jgi:hypothetical protein
VTPLLPSERSFGLSVGGACLAIAALLWGRGHVSAPAVLAGAGALLVVFGAAYPPALRPVNRVWWRFAQALGWFNARVILSVFFALVLTPAGLLMRIARRDPLRASGAHTNWTPYPVRRRDPRHFERMY